VRWAGVREATLAEHGAVSDKVALELAVGARLEARTHWGLSTTGYVGPDGGTAEAPVGTVFVGLSGPGKHVEVERHRFAGDRERVRAFAAYAALDLLRRHLLLLQRGGGEEAG
jgi:nicotinamide-nucleotide amidase